MDLIRGGFMALTVRDAYGINEKLLRVLAQQDPTWEKALQVWEKAKLYRFDSLTQDQMAALEAIEMDLQETESNEVFRLF
jgi:hypothetical protein